MPKFIFSTVLSLCLLCIAATSAYAISYEIFFWDGLETTQLTNDNVDDIHPDLYDGEVVWEKAQKIYYWDGNSTTLVPGQDSYNVDPCVYKGTVAYQSDQTSRMNSGDISYWDGSTTTRIGHAYDGMPALDNGTIAFASGTSSNSFEIYTWNNGTTRRITNDNTPDAEMAIHDGKIAYSSAEGSNFEIRYWDNGTDIRLTNTSYNERYVDLHNGEVVWSTDGNIFYWNGSDIVQVTSNGRNGTPTIYNGRIVWTGFDGNDWELYLWDGLDTLQLTNNNTNDFEPQLFGNTIAWRGYDDGVDTHAIIYDGTDPVPEPATVMLFGLGIIGLASVSKKKKSLNT